MNSLTMLKEKLGNQSQVESLKTKYEETSKTRVKRTLHMKDDEYLEINKKKKPVFEKIKRTKHQENRIEVRKTGTRTVKSEKNTIR